MNMQCITDSCTNSSPSLWACYVYMSSSWQMFNHQLIWTNINTWMDQICDFVFTFNLMGSSQMALVGKNPSANARDGRDTGSIPGSGRPPGGGHGNPLQDSCLENSMDRGAWQASDHRVAKSCRLLKRLHTH